MKKYIIYQLVDPKTYKPFYVGITTKTLAERLAVHMWCARNRPYGDISEYINSLSAKPFVDVLEVLENASFEAARIRELHWFNELKGRGFELKNSDRPFNNDEPMKDRLNNDELQVFRDSLKYLTSINRIHGEIIKMQSAHRVAKSGSGMKETIEKVRKFLSIIQSGNIPNFKNKYTPCMVVLSETEMKKLAEWKSSVNLKKLHQTVGVWGNTIARALKLGYLRRDKYLKIESFIK